MIRSGRHDQRLTFQRLTVTTDAIGSVIESWAAVCTVWGEVRSEKTEEGVESSQRTGRASYIVVTRADTRTRTLTASDRLRWNGMDFDLSPPRPIPAGRPERIEFTATGRAN